jgi:stage V sporulation protein AD
MFSYIIKQMKEGKLKKVLYVPTGAIFSPTMFYQRDTIPSIAHAISLEVV